MSIMRKIKEHPHIEAKVVCAGELEEETIGFDEYRNRLIFFVSYRQPMEDMIKSSYDYLKEVIERHKDLKGREFIQAVYDDLCDDSKYKEVLEL